MNKTDKILILLIFMMYSICIFILTYSITNIDNYNISKNNPEYCKQYSDLDIVHMKYKDRVKYVLLNDTYVKESIIKDNCLESQ